MTIKSGYVLPSSISDRPHLSPDGAERVNIHVHQTTPDAITMETVILYDDWNTGVLELHLGDLIGRNLIGKRVTVIISEIPESEGAECVNCQVMLVSCLM